MTDLDTDAGDGNAHVFKLNAQGGTDNGAFQPGKHYLALDSAVWFVNADSSWISKKSVAGTIEITLNGDVLPVVLGQFDLEKDQQVAPIFGKALVPCAPYIQGTIDLKTVIQIIERDNTAGTLLKKMASATLSTMTGTLALETTAGGLNPFQDAGSALLAGAQQALSADDDKVDVFNPIDVTIDPTADLIGTENFLLLHRGADNLDEGKFRVKPGGTDVLYDGQAFRDGAWLLLRIRRLSAYAGNPRPWSTLYFELKSDFNQMIESWSDQIYDVKYVEDNLSRGSGQAVTLADRVLSLATRIRGDKALIEADQNIFSAVLGAYLRAAKDACAKNDPQQYFKDIGDIHDGLLTKKPYPATLRGALLQELKVRGQKVDRLDAGGGLTSDFNPLVVEDPTVGVIGVDSSSPAPTTGAYETASRSVAPCKIAFWGRYFKDKMHRGDTQYSRDIEGEFFSKNAIKLLPFARETAQVVRGEVEGAQWAQSNVEAFFEEIDPELAVSRAKSGELLFVLDVEPNVDVTSDFYRGWSTKVVDESRRVTNNKLTLLPCVYLSHACNDGSIHAINQVCAQGGNCYGLIFAGYPRPEDNPSPWVPRSWSTGPVIPRVPTGVRVLAWQYAGDCPPNKVLDYIQVDPDSIISEYVLQRMIVPA